MTKQLIDTSRNAEIYTITASSGGGKSSIVKPRLQQHQRVIIFDPDDEYGDVKGVTTADSCQHLLQKLIETKGGALKIRLVANSIEAWDFCAAAAFEWGNCAFVGEEMAGRTSAGKARGWWHTLVTRGRKRGIVIYGITQRIAECDKTIVGNSSQIFVGRLTRSADRKLISQEIDVPIEVISDLQKLQFIRADMDTGERFFLDVKTGKERKFTEFKR